MAAMQSNACVPSPHPGDNSLTGLRADGLSAHLREPDRVDLQVPAGVLRREQPQHRVVGIPDAHKRTLKRNEQPQQAVRHDVSTPVMCSASMSCGRAAQRWPPCQARHRLAVPADDLAGLQREQRAGRRALDAEILSEFGRNEALAVSAFRR